MHKTTEPLAPCLLRPPQQGLWFCGRAGGAGVLIDQTSMVAAVGSSAPNLGPPMRLTSWDCRPKFAKTGTPRVAASLTSRPGARHRKCTPASAANDSPLPHPPPAAATPPPPAVANPAHPLPPPAGTDGAELEANALGQQMRSWVVDAGGYIHPALALSCATPYGRCGHAAACATLAASHCRPCMCVRMCARMRLLPLIRVAIAAVAAEELWQ